ncbi:MAG: excinuclease ABC subunit UvrC [Candidatus Babeliales bacterium]|jgi:excinuclease ABC subunit C
MKKETRHTLVEQVKKFPAHPGVYIFKGADNQPVYIGKAKNLKKRGRDYLQRYGMDVKVDAIFAASIAVEYQLTTNELEALLLEAHLVMRHQPRCNVLLKHGQPFLYLFISSAKIPEFSIVRSQKRKGTYFGPFLEKTSARKVYDFLVKTFRLKLCKKKIANGCLYYHMGVCAGACRPDFDSAAYMQRLELAKRSLQQGHKKFLESLLHDIAAHNARREFEKSRELHGYYLAFKSVFDALKTSSAIDHESVAYQDIWIASPDDKALFVFRERDGVLTKRQVFYFPLGGACDQASEYFMSFYRTYAPPSMVMVNFDLATAPDVIKNFMQEWHHKDYATTIAHPKTGHGAALIRLGLAHVQQEQLKQSSLSRALKALFKISYEPHAIDCFDVSHKQGRNIVGSCVRFVDGKPDKKNFRHFIMKTVDHNDDYACLREIVFRRYKDRSEMPDVVLIDGGKGQLSAVADLVGDTEIVALAKREETIFSRHLPQGKKLNPKKFADQMVIALRDYAHHFAISFHREHERRANS